MTHIPEEAVHIALEAAIACKGLATDNMRAALQAALPRILGEPVGYRVGNGGDIWVFRKKPGNGWKYEEPLYALKEPQP